MNAETAKKRISYAEFQAQLAAQSLNFDAMEFEKTPLLLDGEPVTYAGHHFDSLVWLKHKNTVGCFKQKDVRGRLKMVPDAKGN